MTQSGVSKMAYKSTQSKYKGGAHTYYIIYEIMHQYRGKVRKMRKRVKKVYISGVLKNWERGTFRLKSGGKGYGIRFTYENPRISFTAKRGKTKYHQPRALVTVEKVIPIPEGARKVKVTSKRPKEALKIT